MQTDIKIRYCKTHPKKEINGFCERCKEFFCKECAVDHIGHEIVEVENYCKDRKISIYELAAQLEEKKKKMIEIATKLKEGPMEYNVALFISRRKWIFRERACINCPVDEFCACDGADILFDIDGVMRKELIDVGQGVRMTEPLKVEKGLLAGRCIRASLSHNGILAICAEESSSEQSNDECTIQFTDLNTNRQVFMKVESYSLVAFYDSMILLTSDKPLREARVEEVFKNPTIEIFKEIEGTSNVDPSTDVSLLHVRRVLYYPTTNNKLFSFNVDTRMNTEIDVGKYIWTIASFTGIDSDVKAVFQSNDDWRTYTLNNDNTVTKVDERRNRWLRALFPSTSNPTNIRDAVFKYWDVLMKDGNWIDTSRMIEFEYNYSVIRVYRDVFLAYDWKKESWVLVRIIVP